MKKIKITLLFQLIIGVTFAQKLTLNNQAFELKNVTGAVVDFQGEKVLKIERDLKALPFDVNRLETTVDDRHFAKLTNLDFEDGTIEVKMYSQIQNPSPFPGAQGFIGLYFRVDEQDANFESIYLRPKVGRSDNQFRRNHAVQYFAYPNYKFETLRKKAPGRYEGAAPVDINEWITMRIEVNGKRAELFINDAKYSNFVVDTMLGKSTHGAIGLYVDIGTIGYFKDLKVTPRQKSSTNASETDKYFTTSDGVKLHYRVSGKGEPLVILPGYGQDITKLKNVYETLEKHYTVYCLDYRWLGKSGSPAYGYHIERFAKDAKEMIDHAQIDRFHLFAHSMGNSVAWCYFSIFGQEKVLKYILGDEAPCLITDPNWTDNEVATFTGSSWRKDMFTAWRPPASTKPEKLTLEADMMSRLLNDHLGRDWRDVIPTIKIPTLIVMADKSHFESPLLWNWLKDNIHGARLEVIKGAGHGFYETHGEVFNEMVLDFLKK
jgi:pimeloyl-ACP methyl ester carboxylesterase